MNSLKYLWLTIVVGLLVCLPGTVPAQETDQDAAQEATAASDFTLETLTVEAQKREEDIQEVPLSITGLSDVRLDESRVYDFRDLDLAVPNLNFVDFGNRAGFSFVGIRGLASSRLSVDPAVGVYIDDIPITDFLSLSSPLLFNLQRAEVLRGPQSTLWGLNTEAGALLFYTRDPGEEWSGFVKAEAATHDTFLGQASAGGALVDGQLYLNLDIAADTTDGHIENVFNGEPAGDNSAFGVRSKLLWTPTEELEVKFTLLADSIDAGESILQLPLDRDAYREATGIDLDEFEVSLDTDGETERNSNAQSLRLQYQTDWFDIVSITSRRQVSSDAPAFDADDISGLIDFTAFFDPTGTLPAGTFQSTVEGVQFIDILEYSTELRLVSPEYDDLPLKWIAGLFYLTFDDDTFGDAIFTELGVNDNFIDAELTGYNLAAFGQATYRLWNEKLGLTAGVRVERALRELDRDDSRVTVSGEKATDTEFLPRFVIDYMITDDLMTYFSAAKGWRNGGLNPAATSEDQLEYEKETAWTYEVGLKSVFFDERLLFNVALFHTEIDDFQDSIPQADFSTTFDNAEEVQIRGVDVELKALPLPGLLFEVGFGLADGEYETYDSSQGFDFSGNSLANVPEWELTTIAQYTFPVGFYVRGEFFAVGETFFEAANTNSQGQYELYNARIGFQRDRYDFYLFGENLSDEQYFLAAGPSITGLTVGPVGPGRTVGGGISVNF